MAVKKIHEELADLLTPWLDANNGLIEARNLYGEFPELERIKNQVTRAMHHLGYKSLKTKGETFYINSIKIKENK